MTSIEGRINQAIFGVICVSLFIFPWRDAIPAFGAVSVGRTFGVVIALLLVLGIFTDSIRRPTIFHALLLGFVTWSAVTILWAPGLSEGVRDTARMGFAFVMAVGLWQSIETRRHFEIALGSMLAGTVVLLGFVAVDFFTTGIESRSDMMFGFNAAIVGRRLAYCTPIAGYILLRSSKRSLQMIAITLLLMMIPAMLAMAVRQGFIAIIGAVVFIVAEIYDRNTSGRISAIGARQRLSGRVIGMAVAGIGSLVTISWLVYQQLGQYRMEYLTRFEWTLTGRTEMWLIGVDVLREEGVPFLGVGIGAYNSYIGPMTSISNQSNSALFGIGVEMGVIGLILFVATIVAAIFLIGVDGRRDLALTLSIISIYLPLGIVADVHQDLLGWVLLALIVISARLTIPAKRVLEAGSPTPTLKREPSGER